MQKIIPEKLQKGDKIMIVAPSTGLKIIGQDCRQIAKQRFEEMGLTIEFAPNTNDENWNMFGGFNSNQLLEHLDYEIIRKNPKIFCGFSDITALHGAIYAQTGLETYYGPHYSSIGMAKGCEYTWEYLQKMLFSDDSIVVKPAEMWSDDLWFINQEQREFILNEGYWNIHNGEAEGTIIGGNLCTFNLLLGTKYRPEFKEDTVLFVEDTESSSIKEFDRNLQALCYQSDFKNVKALVVGRFQKGSKVTREQVEFMINNKPELENIPVLANVDFGHATPILTIPLGGTATVKKGGLVIKK